MNKLISVFYFCCILVFGSVVQSAEISLWQKWNDSVLDTSLNKGKLILLKVDRNGCRYCEYMDKNVFSDPSLNAFINKHFIPVSVNISEETMPLGLKASMTPSFYFITAKKKVVKRVLGAWRKDDFSSLLKTMVKGEKE